MKKIILFIILLIYWVPTKADFVSANGGHIVVNYKDGLLYDGGDIPWDLNFCSKEAEYFCFLTEGYWFSIAIPKKGVKKGDKWYFSGRLYEYIHDISDDEYIIRASTSLAVQKQYPDTCKDCFSLLVVHDGEDSLYLKSIFIYNSDKPQAWSYSERGLALNRIPDDLNLNAIINSEESKKRKNKNYIFNFNY